MANKLEDWITLRFYGGVVVATIAMYFFSVLVMLGIFIISMLLAEVDGKKWPMIKTSGIWLLLSVTFGLPVYGLLMLMQWLFRAI